MPDSTRTVRNSVGGYWETPDQADGSMADELSGGRPYGFKRYDDIDEATGLEPPEGAGYVMLQVEGQALRWRDDGQDPTPTVGMRLDVTGELRYDGDLSAFRVIGEAAGSILNASFYGPSNA